MADKIYRSQAEEQLDRDGRMVIKAHGVSMLPFIRPESDNVIIDKPAEPVRKYDIALFFFNGRMLLHRVIDYENGRYVMRGDNCISCEEGVPEADVIGTVAYVIKGNKRIDVHSKRSMTNAVLWNKFIILRRISGFYYRGKRKLRSMFG